MYTTPLSSIINSRHLSHPFHADDTQIRLYKSDLLVTKSNANIGTSVLSVAAALYNMLPSSDSWKY